MEFSLNGFTEFSEFSDKNICHYSKRARTCHLLCLRPGCYHSISKTHVRGKIFKLSPIYASVICQFHWIRWIQWIPVPFRENSNGATLSIFVTRATNFSQFIWKLNRNGLSNQLKTADCLFWRNIYFGEKVLKTPLQYFLWIQQRVFHH